jgi:hypothetical protein
MEPKIERLLRDFRFAPLGEVCEDLSAEYAAATKKP